MDRIFQQSLHSIRPASSISLDRNLRFTFVTQNLVHYKNIGSAKKKIMAKSGQTLKKKCKKKYHTKNHTINESKLRAGIKASVEELFAPIKYRVMNSFTVAGVDAALYEEIHFKFGIWTLRKRSGEKILFKCEKADIEKYIKLESEGITLEDIDV